MVQQYHSLSVHVVGSFVSRAQRIRVGSRPSAFRPICNVVFTHVSVRVKQLVHWTQRAHSAVARARVGGIVHWSLFIVEHDNHFQGNKLLVTYFIPENLIGPFCTFTRESVGRNFLLRNSVVYRN